MLSRALFVRLEAKPEKADDVAAFLAQGLQLAQQETTTPQSGSPCGSVPRHSASSTPSLTSCGTPGAPDRANRQRAHGERVSAARIAAGDRADRRSRREASVTGATQIGARD